MKNTSFPSILYNPFEYSEEEMIRKSEEFYFWADKRRSIREFSNKPVPKEIIENIIKTANTAPSGAHKQPWTFVLIDDPELKHRIRIEAEREEKLNYESRMSEEWLKDLAPLGTTWEKPYIEKAPYIIVIFEQQYGWNPETKIKSKNYYVKESVGIAVGILILAIHNAGLCTLTHTPSPMNFLREILKRPKNERAYVMMPVGYPSKNVRVPDLKRKKLNEIIQWNTH
ncbi:MAG: nitroreductase family protein [Candidatus Thorarchaeota archaeon]